MKEKVKIVLGLFLLFSILSCTKKANEKIEMRTIVDHTGSEISIPKKIKRVVIASLLPLPSVYCLYLGGPEKLVGIPPSSKAAGANSYLAKFYPAIQNISSDFVKNNLVNVEEVLALKPDIVFYNAGNSAERELFVHAGIPCVGFSTKIAGYNTIETYASWIELLSEIFGDTGKAKSIIDYGRNVYKKISERTEKIAQAKKPKVLFLYSCEANSISTYGGNMFNQFWIETCGGINVSENLHGSNTLNMEQIYEWNPDMIFLTNFTPALPEDLYENKIGDFDWSHISAIKNKRVFKNPLGMYRWAPPSSDTPLALQWFAKQMQPEIFSDIDMDSEIKNYFKKFYGVSLQNIDLEKIYHPAREASGK